MVCHSIFIAVERLLNAAFGVNWNEMKCNAMHQFQPSKCKIQFRTNQALSTQNLKFRSVRLRFYKMKTFSLLNGQSNDASKTFDWAINFENRRRIHEFRCRFWQPKNKYIIWRDIFGICKIQQRPRFIFYY